MQAQLTGHVSKDERSTRLSQQQGSAAGTTRCQLPHTPAVALLASMACCTRLAALAADNMLFGQRQLILNSVAAKEGHGAGGVACMCLNATVCRHG